jgi:hypothetical protein
MFFICMNSLIYIYCLAVTIDTTQRNADGSVKSGRQVTSQEGQTFSVTQIKAPRLCNHGATTDDLLEISYVGSLPDLGGRIFDGSAVSIDGQGIPGRGNDVSLFFVQGKQPFGQFPPGWDVGINGMCVVRHDIYIVCMHDMLVIILYESRFAFQIIFSSLF